MKWAAVIMGGDPLALGRLRLLTGVEVCRQEDCLWLRGEGDGADLSLRKVPGARRFGVLPGGRLLPAGARVPAGTLPDGPWMPLSQYLVPRPQPAALSGHAPSRVPLRVVRSGTGRPANVLLTDAAAWATYAGGAPRIRLRPLVFATASDGRTIVRGQPLPAMPGVPMVETDGVAVPCGYRWLPAVDAGVVRRLVGGEAGDLVLLWPDDLAEIIPEDRFVGATRVAARCTAREIDGD